MAKKEQAPPPPALQQAYDDLLARYEALRATPQGAVVAEAGELARQRDQEKKGEIERATAALRRERDDLLEQVAQLKGEAERSRNAARLAQQELAAARAPAPARAANERNFLYVQGDFRTGARERVRALTQREADALAAPLLEQGYKFRGCEA